MRRTWPSKLKAAGRAGKRGVCKQRLFGTGIRRGNYGVHSYPCNEEVIVRCDEFPSSSTRRFVGILTSLGVAASSPRPPAGMYLASSTRKFI